MRTVGGTTKRRMAGLLAGAMLFAMAGCDTLSHRLAGEPLPGTRAALEPPPDLTVAGDSAWQGDQATAPHPAFLTARTEPEWQALWQATGTPAPGPLPPGTLAAGVFLSQRPTGGYAVAIEDWSIQPVSGAGEVLLIGWREKVPPADAAVTQALTSPWAIKLLRATSLPAHFAPLE